MVLTKKGVESRALVKGSDEAKQRMAALRARKTNIKLGLVAKAPKRAGPGRLKKGSDEAKQRMASLRARKTNKQVRWRMEELKAGRSGLTESEVRKAMKASQKASKAVNRRMARLAKKGKPIVIDIEDILKG